MKQDDGVALIKLPFRETATDLLKNYGSGGGSVIDEGYFINIISVDKAFDNIPRVEDSGAESVEVEVIRLLDELELPLSLSSEDGVRTTAEASVVDPGDTEFVVRELVADFG